MKDETEAGPKDGRPAGRPSPFPRQFGLPFDRWLPQLINSSHLIQLEASIHPELDENLRPRPEGDDGRRKSSKLSRRWLMPPLATMASPAWLCHGGVHELVGFIDGVHMAVMIQTNLLCE